MSRRKTARFFCDNKLDLIVALGVHKFTLQRRESRNDS